MNARSFMILAATVLTGVGAIWLGTDGFAAFTSEGARRLEVARNPRPLPVIEFEDHRGMITRLADLRGKVLALEFIYTRCPTLCLTLGSSFEQLRMQIRHAGLADRVALLSISFDIRNDGPVELADYAARFGGADDVWMFVRPRTQAELSRVLRIAEVIVVPDGFGGFVHNAAIHVVDRQGRLVAILDSEAVSQSFDLMRRLL